MLNESLIEESLEILEASNHMDLEEALVYFGCDEEELEALELEAQKIIDQAEEEAREHNENFAISEYEANKFWEARS